MSVEIRGLNEHELQTHSQLIYESYSEYIDERPFLADEDWWLRNARLDPYYSPEQTRILLVDGEMVSSVSSYLRHIYCDGRTAKVGAIGAVATHPDYRRRGYARKLLAVAREWMKDNDFHFSFLFGNEDIYGGSGWRFLSKLTTTATFAEISPDTALTVRQAVFDDDVAALYCIYDEFNRELTGPFIRSKPYWRDRVTRGYYRDNTKSYYLIEDNGEAVGYYRSTNAGSISELGWRRFDSDLPRRIIKAILAQWPDIRSLQFDFYCDELVEALRPSMLARSQQAFRDNSAAITLEETSAGLWTYIGPGGGEFDEITDTESLLVFLSRRDYVFWGGVDSF